MGVLSDAAVPAGDGPRARAEIDRAITATRTARGLEASSVGRGGLRVHGDAGIDVSGGGSVGVSDGGDVNVTDGGSVFVRGTGGVTVQGGARIRAEYPSGKGSATIGSASVTGTGEHYGDGLFVWREDNGLPILRASQRADGTGEFEVGFATAPVNECNIYVDTSLAMTSNGTAHLGGFDGGTFLYPESGAGDATVHMESSTGRITYVLDASTQRVKRDIQDFGVDPSAVLQLRPRTWLPEPAVRICPEWVHAQHGDEAECPGGDPVDSPDDEIRQVGFVAEELAELGLSAFVRYDDEGLPAAIHYDRLTAALIPVVQRQQEQIDELTRRLDAVEQAQA